MPAEKPLYEPPTIRRYAPFFAGSPSKPAGLMQRVDSIAGERSVVSLTVPAWELDSTEGGGKPETGE